MNPGSGTESYPAFARIGLRENPGKTSTRIIQDWRQTRHGFIPINRNLQLDALLFADDLVVMASTEDDLQYSVHNLNIVSEKYNMEINIEKSKIMSFCGKFPVPSKICLNNKIIERIPPYCTVAVVSASGKYGSPKERALSLSAVCAALAARARRQGQKNALALTSLLYAKIVLRMIRQSPEQLFARFHSETSDNSYFPLNKTAGCVCAVALSVLEEIRVQYSMTGYGVPNRNPRNMQQRRFLRACYACCASPIFS
ncbi:hypothetical protein ANN_10408 [Periplaneta americana]|uniref:Reverse transcriptase domain-containing protein n=1 Tax=Periplaneta americana TaxID=6978 RepID=A0ABQ8TP72_PERAM|nr:hypothetical protein ANN_10408 [Periplaneta americana]